MPLAVGWKSCSITLAHSLLALLIHSFNYLFAFTQSLTDLPIQQPPLHPQTVIYVGFTAGLKAKSPSHHSLSSLFHMVLLAQNPGEETTEVERCHCADWVRL